MDREDFMDIVYAELASDPDNSRANRIIWAADGYAESAQLGTNLAEVGTDTVSRQAALDIFDDYNVAVENGQIEAYSRDRKRLCDLPPAQPEIIRCKDCNHFYKDNLNQWCFLGKYGVKENGFCSRAERRTNE